MIIDLCSGFGRWNTDEEVISIDIQRKCKPDIIADIRFLPLRLGLKPKLVHASPPCKYVSKARRWGYGWNPKGVAESFRLLAACFDAFAYLDAETCTLEQPAGLEDLLGTKFTFKYDKGGSVKLSSESNPCKKSSDSISRRVTRTLAKSKYRNKPIKFHVHLRELPESFDIFAFNLEYFSVCRHFFGVVGSD